MTAENKQTNKVHTQVYTSASQSQHAVIHGSPSLIAHSFRRAATYRGAGGGIGQASGRL